MVSSNLYKPVLAITSGFLILWILTKFNGIVYFVLGLNFFALISEKFLRSFNFLLEKVSGFIKNVIIYLLFGLVYFSIVTPIGFFYRRKGKTPFNLGKHSDTYFLDVNKKFGLSDFKKQW